MSWNIVFYKNQHGKEIVKDFIRSLEKAAISKVSRQIDLLRHNGPFLGMPYSKRISDNLYELRMRGRQEIRIFYTFGTNYIYLLHIFQKKSQRTPTKEIEIAIKRLKHLT